MRKLNLPFYLTGGTALSRFYFNHRYSDDLDYFINNDSNFNNYCHLLYTEFDKNQREYKYILDKKKIIRAENFMQVILQREDYELKIDFVNDIAPHFGEFIFDNYNNKIDSLKNILSNKFTALYRFEPKDIVDIWIICKNYKCDFVEIISEAKLKEATVDPITIYEILISFPVEKLDLIKWGIEINKESFQKDLYVIANDIFNGRKNSLAV